MVRHAFLTFLRGARPARLRDERGAVIVLILVGMLFMLGMAGLSVDMGRGYLEKYRLGRAVDAGVLAAARSLRLGQTVAQQEALSVARLNGVRSGFGGVSTTLAFGTNAQGEATVSMAAQKNVPTIFMRIFGQNQMDVAASATAAVAPVDMVLVLDQSGSLGTQRAWDDLQRAADRFIRYFSDQIDQVGLVSFQIRATDRFLMAHNFTAPIVNSIWAMQSAGDTNTGEGLRLADLQLQRPNARTRAVKVVVFFTDGRPTALRGMLGTPGQERDRAMAVYTTNTGVVRGYFNNPDQLNPDVIANPPNGCRNVSRCFNFWIESTVRNTARQNGVVQANALRSQGVIIYTIGLGNPNAGNPILVPDMVYLRSLANENGTTDPNQPRGKAYLAPSAAQLRRICSCGSRANSPAAGTRPPCCGPPSNSRRSAGCSAPARTSAGAPPGSCAWTPSALPPPHPAPVVVCRKEARAEAGSGYPAPLS